MKPPPHSAWAAPAIRRIARRRATTAIAPRASGAPRQQDARREHREGGVGLAADGGTRPELPVEALKRSGAARAPQRADHTQLAADPS